MNWRAGLWAAVTGFLSGCLYGYLLRRHPSLGVAIGQALACFLGLGCLSFTLYLVYTGLRDKDLP